MTYVIKFKTLEARTSEGKLCVKAGNECWVCDDEWLGATAISAVYLGLPYRIKTFESVQDAERFMSSWEGDPWYYKPSRNFEILKVQPRMVQQGWELTRMVQQGWELKDVEEQGEGC